MRIRVKSDLQKIPSEITKFERQVPYATSVALNRTADEIKRSIVDQMPRVFDRPTPYTLRSLRVDYARKSDLKAHVTFRDAAGKGTSADKYLSPQVYGGGRSQKRSERAFEGVGVLKGYLVPGGAARLDAYGNHSRGQVIQLLSYFQAFGEQGYRANATEKGIARLAKISGGKKKGYKKINGVVYFISRGKGSMSGNREQVLPAGIWQKKGTHGVDVSPVLLSVDAPQYTQRLPFYETAQEVFGDRFEDNFASALDAALASAR